MRKTSYGGYREDHFDLKSDGYEVEIPSDVLSDAVDDLNKEIKPLVRKMIRVYKKMGFSISVDPYDDGFNNYEDDRTTVVYNFELSVRGGQKIVIGRKQMVASGNYRFEFQVFFHSDEDVDIEQHPDHYEIQVDVDDFEQHAAWYYVPSSSFEFFAFGGDDLDRIENREYDSRDVERACEESVYLLFKDLSGKWRKKRASDRGSLVQKVALLKLQKIARLESHADFVKAIYTAFKDREDESMLSSISNKARNLEDTEFGKEVSDLCSMLIGRLGYIEELRRDSTGYGFFDRKPDWD